MESLSWNDITVEQFQQVYKLSLSQDLDEITKTERVVCILYGLTERQVEELPMPRFRELATHCAFIMTGEIPGKPQRQIKVGGNRYRIVYNPENLKQRQYVEVMHFGDNPIENMHVIMASLVNPVTWYGKTLKNNAEDHKAIADDLLQARVIDVYHSCVFFCNLYVNLINSTKAYLVHQTMKEGKTMQESIQLWDFLQSVTAGCIPPEKLRYMNV